MLTAILILILLAAILLWLPLKVEVNTAETLYQVRYGRLIRAWALPHPEDIFRIHLRVLFWNHRFSPLDRKKDESSSQKKKHRISRKGKRSLSPPKALRLLRTFRVRAFRWELDTGQPTLNAKLYPVFFLSGLHKGGSGINFEGRNALALEIENRPIRMLRAWIQP